MSGLSSNYNYQQRVLPCYPGYTMGAVVRNQQLELSYLKEQHANLLTIREKIERDIKRIREQENRVLVDKERFEREFEREREKKQEDIIKKILVTQKLTGIIRKQSDIQDKLNLNAKEFKATDNKIKNVKQRIKKLEEESKEDDAYFEEAMPIDYRFSKMITKHNSVESENMHSILLSENSTMEDIDDFTSHLFGMRYLPEVTELIQRIANTILGEAQKQRTVFLIGSFITLSHVKIIDPVVIRKNAKYKNLQEQSDQYSVICEAVLGGVFIGFSAQISQQEKEEQDERELDREAMQSLATTLKVFSFVSQGAIPLNHNNLWETYQDWRKKLQSNENSGFPIGFKVRSLSDIVEENENYEVYEQ